MDPLHDLCLTCLSKPSIAHNLSDIILDNLKILEILKNLIPKLMENPEIPLPNCICYVCVDKLVIAYKFQKQCLGSVENLYRLWKESFKEKIVKEELDVYELDKSDKLEEDSLTKENYNEHDKLGKELLTKENADCLALEKYDLSKNKDDSTLDKNDFTESFNNSSSASESDSEEEYFKDKFTNNMDKKETINKEFKCKHCNKVFVTISSLKQHLVFHSDKKPYPCTICNKAFNRTTTLRQHLECHNNKRPFSSNEYQNLDSNEVITKVEDIEISNEQFINQVIADTKEELHILVNGIEEDELNELKNTKEGLESTVNECKLCNKTFKLAHGLNLHMTTKHFRKHPYNCEICNKGFMVEEHYIKHKNRHLGIKTFKCKECGKAFDSNSTLNQHLISHSKDTPYLCTICGKSFNRSGTLRQHTLRHGDATPYNCSQCGKKFKCHSDLLSHIAKHNADKCFECEICGKRLATNTSMLHHKRVHSGEKPFKCDFCDKCFNSSSNMKSHRRIHTGEKPYNCPFCDKTFRQSNDCKKHAKRMHTKEWLAANVELSGDEDK